MCTMKDVCEKVGLSYETLRFYCNEGLVPNVKRDENNYRSFDEKDIKWLQSLMCLKKCGMSIKDMKRYMELCLEGASSIPERKLFLNEQRKILMEKIDEINESVNFIDKKQEFYDGVLEGKIKYTSNIIK